MKNNKAFVINGRKFYPCASFEKNQHKLDYWATYYTNKYYDNGDERDYEMMEMWENIFCMSTVYTLNDGIIYFPYPEYQIVKEGIVEYDLKH